MHKDSNGGGGDDHDDDDCDSNVNSGTFHRTPTFIFTVQSNVWFSSTLYRFVAASSLLLHSFSSIFFALRSRSHELLLHHIMQYSKFVCAFPIFNPSSFHAINLSFFPSSKHKFNRNDDLIYFPKAKRNGFVWMMCLCRYLLYMHVVCSTLHCAALTKIYMYILSEHKSEHYFFMAVTASKTR